MRMAHTEDFARSSLLWAFLRRVNSAEDGFMTSGPNGQRYSETVQAYFRSGTSSCTTSIPARLNLPAWFYQVNFQVDVYEVVIVLALRVIASHVEYVEEVISCAEFAHAHGPHD